MSDGILVLTAGGTRDKKHSDARRRYQIPDTIVTRLRALARLTHPYVVEEVLRKNSVDLTDEDRAKVIKHPTCARCSRIVITHGIDATTLTAQALSEVQDKTIVLTGALAPASVRVMQRSTSAWLLRLRRRRRRASIPSSTDPSFTAGKS